MKCNRNLRGKILASTLIVSSILISSANISNEMNY